MKYVPLALLLATVIVPVQARDVTLAPDQLPGLTITLPGAGTFQIPVTATGPGGSVTRTLTIIATLPTPPPLPAPTVTVQDAEGLVGEPIPLDITATDADSVTFTIPDDATLSTEGFIEGALPLPAPDVFLTASCAAGQLSAAGNQAVAAAAAGSNVQITLSPCTYRETLTLQFSSKGNTGSISVEGVAGTVISGSDVFTGWTQDASGVWSTVWPHDFGLRGWESAWPTTLPQDELLKRVEVFFVNGTRLKQVVALADLVDGSFYIDEPADKVFIKSATDLNATLVEGAVRKQVIFINRASNIALRGIQAVHATSQVSQVTAVRVQNSYNILLEDSVIRDNSGIGMSTVATNRVSSVRNQYLDNGYAGWVTWRVNHLLSQDDVVSGSNWRGFPFGFVGYAVAGFKHHSVHNAVYQRLAAVDNLTGGMWWDGDIENVVMEDSRLCGNSIRGAFLEKIQGPLLLRGLTVCNNGKWGFIVSSSQNVTIEDSTFRNNGIAQINFGGGSTASWSNWETDKRYSSLRTDLWAATNNKLLALGAQVIVGYISSPSRLPPNFAASGNTCETASPTAQDGAICQ